MKLSKIVLISILSVFLLVGCTQNDQPEASKPNDVPVKRPNETPKPDESVGTDYSEEIKFSVIDIYDKYLVEFDGVSLYNIELSLKELGYVYELEGSDATDEHEVTYDAISGEKIKYEKDIKDSTKVALTKDDLLKIENLFNNAHADAGAAYRLDEWTLKVKDGVKLFEIELKDASRHEIEYKYNLDSGELLKKN